MAYTTINKSTDYFDTTLITGNGSTQDITGLGFQPDWIWMKRRNATGHNRLIDAVRGSNKLIQSDLSNAEGTDATYVTSFNSDGWSIGTNTDINATGGTAVGWSWLGANGTASNTDGSTTSTVSANTTSGFSIVTWTVPSSGSATVGHGLGAVPKMIISKSRSNATDWEVHHTSLANTQTIQLNSGNAAGTNNAYNDTDPTSSVFSVTASGFGADRTMVSYCFAEKKGYSKFGIYTSNNNADGTFVYTGFRPAFIILKNSTSGGTNWHSYDNKRLGYNVDNNSLLPSSSNAESTADQIDILSNGFKLRYVGDNNNGSDNIIYMAFGQSLVGSNNVPCTAR